MHPGKYKVIETLQCLLKTSNSTVFKHILEMKRILEKKIKKQKN